MFGLDMSDPQTYWLNVTNIGLGVVALVCCGAIAWAVLREAIVRTIDRVLARPAAAPIDAHAYHAGELGLTMADGGEPHSSARDER